MMVNKKNLVLVLLAILVLVVAIVALSGKKKTNIELPMVEPTTTPEPYTSDTGAKYISPTQKEREEIDEIKDLRNKVPFENDLFAINFSYKTNLFEVVLKNKTESVETEFKKWLTDNNYGKISAQYFLIK